MSNKQRFIKNLSLLYIATFISKIFALVINIVLVRKLGISIYGAFGFALTFIAYFTLIADSGLSPYGETIIAMNKSNAKIVAGNIFSFNLILAFISTAIILLLVFEVFKFGSIQANMLLLVSFLPIIDVFGFNYVIKALEKNKIIILSIFCGRLIYLSGIILFVFQKNDYLFAILFFIIGALVTSAIQFRFVIGLIGKIKLNFSLRNFKHLAVNGMPFGVAMALLTLYGSLPVLFLKILSSDKNIGYYYMAGRLVFFISSFIGLIMGAFIPIISDAIKNNNFNKQSFIVSELLRFNYTFLIPVCFGGLVLSKSIISVFFGAQYILGAYILDIMLWSTLFMGVSSVFGGYLTVLQDKKSLIISTFISFAAGIFIVPTLIKFYGVYGGAISSPFNELVMMITLYVLILKKGKNKSEGDKIKLSVDIKNFAKVLLISIVMAFFVRFFNVNLHFNLVLCIISGVLIFLFLSVIFGTISKEDLKELNVMLKR